MALDPDNSMGGGEIWRGLTKWRMYNSLAIGINLQTTLIPLVYNLQPKFRPNLQSTKYLPSPPSNSFYTPTRPAQENKNKGPIASKV